MSHVLRLSFVLQINVATQQGSDIIKYIFFIQFKAVTLFQVILIVTQKYKIFFSFLDSVRWLSFESVIKTKCEPKEYNQMKEQILDSGKPFC